MATQFRAIPFEIISYGHTVYRARRGRASAPASIVVPIAGKIERRMGDGARL